jgi:hypothetical protein
MIMAEFDCFLILDEYIDLLEGALGAGFRLILDKNMRELKYEYVSERSAVRDLINPNQKAFLLERDDFSRYPVELRPIQRDGIPIWYPQAVNGGPVIETRFYFPFERDGERTVPCSSIAYSSMIVNPATREREPAGDSIKEAFNSLVLPLRKRSRKVRSKKRTAYVTDGVQAMLDAGWHLARPFDAADPACG